MNKEANISLNSICFGIYLILNFIAGAVADFVEIQNLFPVLAFVIGVLLLIRTTSINKKMLKIKPLLLWLVVLIVVQFIFSLLTTESEITSHYFLCFVTIGLSGLFVASKDVDFKKARHTVVLLSVLNCYHFIKMIGSEYTVYTAGEQMGNAYSVLMILFLSLWTFIDGKETIRWKLLSSADIVLCFALLIKVMTRGAWVCVAVFIILIMLKEFRGKKAFFYVFLLIPISIIIMPFVLDTYLKNTTWYYFMFADRANNVLNGRDTLLKTAFAYNGIIRLFIGSGIGSYYSAYNTYPHNIIAQLFYDQGLISLIVFGKIILSGLKGIVRDFIYGDEMAFLIISLSCASLLRLMISYYFWIDQLFWLLLGLLIKRYYAGKTMKAVKA